MGGIVFMCGGVFINGEFNVGAVEQWGILCGRRLFCAWLNDLYVDLLV